MEALKEKIKRSIERIQRFADFSDTYSTDGQGGYYLAFSGGKDSVVTKRLMDMALVKYDAHYRVTSVDPPELVRFIREYYPDVERDIPMDADGKPITMWNLIPQKLIPPTRVMRYCCDKLKETGGNDRFVVTGVRWAESYSRKKNQGIITARGKKQDLQPLLESDNFAATEKSGIKLINDNEQSREQIEACPTLHKMVLNPIIDWTDADVWEFIRQENIPYCGLYDEGFLRLGCIGCPMAGQHGRERGFLRWPKYKAAYLLAFAAMLRRRFELGLMAGTWRVDTTALDVFRWWMEYDVLPGQMDLLEEDDDVLPGQRDLFREVRCPS